jgi:hypothetical protein
MGKEYWRGFTETLTIGLTQASWLLEERILL